MKFGVLPEHAGALMATAKDLDLNIVGVSFHVGSGCREAAVFYRAIEAAKNVSIVFILEEGDGITQYNRSHKNYTSVLDNTFDLP